MATNEAEITPQSYTHRLDFAHTLYGEHLGESIDACVRAHQRARGRKGQRPRERRSAMSSVMHGYSALEAVANMMKFELYGYAQRRHYVGAAKDDVALLELLSERNWQRLALERKVKVLLRAKGIVLDASLENHIGEVRELRHMLAHGVTTPARIEWSPGTTMPQKVTAAFSTKNFPRLKFAPVDKLKAGDARKVLRVVLETVEALRALTDHMLACTCYALRPQAFFLYDEPIEQLLAQVDAACRTPARKR